jgi:hypothetical protein
VSVSSQIFGKNKKRFSRPYVVPALPGMFPPQREREVLPQSIPKVKRKDGPSLRSFQQILIPHWLRLRSYAKFGAGDLLVL